MPVPRTFTLRLPATVDSVPIARRRLRQWMRQAKLSYDVSEDLALVMTELVTNAIEASPGVNSPVELLVHREAHRVVLVVTDEGTGVGLDHIPQFPSPTSPRGRGLAIVKALMDHIEVHHDHGRTRVEATRSLAVRAS